MSLNIGVSYEEEREGIWREDLLWKTQCDKSDPTNIMNPPIIHLLATSEPDNIDLKGMVRIFSNKIKSW
jgi:hypothetical protein